MADDGPDGPKHVAYYKVLEIKDVLDGIILTIPFLSV
jgi:hypothetical protein